MTKKNGVELNKNFVENFLENPAKMSRVKKENLQNEDDGREQKCPVYFEMDVMLVTAWREG